MVDKEMVSALVEVLMIPLVLVITGCDTTTVVLLDNQVLINSTFFVNFSYQILPFI
jgi:hypothetical protein